ncbi:HAMP domain-containing sensor histidine kinase [Ensifer aridi]|uniref:HAMP domain-containing sensor histidine kinase n=2 Tax=Ensifer aridi TaxID=1708715 RepID=UPI0004052449|nr:HAMP domain-containing sensor histidine kinase [Ensifer aridi]
MQRLLRKMFAMVWLCVAGSIALVFAILSFLPLTPFTEEVQERTTRFALDTASEVLARKGILPLQDVVSAFANADPSVHLTVKAVGAPIECAVSVSDTLVRRVVNSDTCYEVMAVPDDAYIWRQWPKLMPWASALLAAAGAAFWLANYFTRPVEQLRKGLGELARGNFGVRISKEVDRKRDEVAALAHDFDATASRLQEFQEVQQRLFHDVSHELRSPLSRLQAGLGVLRQNPARLNDMLERLEREIQRMDDLVGEILTLAKLAAAADQPLNRQRLDLIDLVREIVDDSIFEGASKQVAVEYDGEESFVTSVDGELIYRAVENVVRNAVKYSPPGSVVRVSSRRTSYSFELIVEDEGPGVPDSALESLFHPFRRFADTPADAAGFGLGLSITKQAFERHGGRIDASRISGSGLRMKMSLPITEADAVLRTMPANRRPSAE